MKKGLDVVKDLETRLEKELFVRTGCLHVAATQERAEEIHHTTPYSAPVQTSALARESAGLSVRRISIPISAPAAATRAR